jgi:alpha-glucosidase
VAAQRDDPASIFSLYRRLSRLRKSSPALRRGTYRTVPAPSGVFAYAREADGERMLVALNFTKSTQLVSLGAGEAQVAFSTDHERDAEPLSLERVELRPDEGIVVARA